ncbi:MAG: hypothetical protein ACREQV_02805 [Candidatus Binatia bacterium]
MGRGKMRLDEFRATLEEAKPHTAAQVAPPHGLFLMRVEYEGIELGNDEYDEDV